MNNENERNIEFSEKNLVFIIKWYVIRNTVLKARFGNRTGNRFFPVLLTGTEPRTVVPVPGIFRNRRALLNNDREI
jgi:hypothetical protein